jgi:ABC-type transport system involved in Fe-S cluster assembly fused permease/ATPase subunit
MHHLVFAVLPVFVELGTEVVVLGRLVALSFLVLFCMAIVCYSVTFCCSAGTITRAGRAASAARVDASAAMTDGLLNFETVKYFTAEELVQERVSRELERCEERWALFCRQYSISGVIVACIFAAFLAATVILASIEVHTGKMTIGAFVLVNTYMLQLVKPIEMLGFAIQGVAQGVAMLEQMLQLFRERREPEHPKEGHFSNGRGTVVFEEVSVAYTPERPVLKKLSFRIQAGCTLGVVGTSGSGKSTVVRLLMRLLEPDSGTILLDGIPISSLPLSDLRRAIAVVPQETLLLNDTLRSNIAFGRPGATHDDIESAARVAQLHDFILTLPEGYETVVGERGVKVSGGERQRISIARAVLKKPRMYVFDEATSSLDSRTEGEILSGLQRISRSTTTLVIAHRLSSVVNADEIIVLEGGQVVECGTHGGLVRQGGRYAALWNSQREGTVAA